jgi:pimeloyl-ACP methyl ester carboxylesterase
MENISVTKDLQSSIKVKFIFHLSSAGNCGNQIVSLEYFTHEQAVMNVLDFILDELGTGDKNLVLVCIHGFPTSSFDWSKVM